MALNRELRSHAAQYARILSVKWPTIKFVGEAHERLGEDVVQPVARRVDRVAAEQRRQCQGVAAAG